MSSDKRLAAIGITDPGALHWNPGRESLVEAAVRGREGMLAAGGALVCRTGRFTGRSPDDKFFVRDAETGKGIDWGPVNRPMDPERFEALRRRVLDHLQGRELYVQDCDAGADPAHRLAVRVVTEQAWHSLFARNIFLQSAEPAASDPEWTILHAPSFSADPESDGCRSSTVIAIGFSQKLILIAGTYYAGEIKKSVFTLLNYLLPPQGVMPMHCSANIGPEGSAVFFGLSGTGKTTLSADPDRELIGDDEHGWSDGGIFNFEGGCYAKVIDLDRKAEPEIHAASHRFGTVLENVVIDADSRALDLANRGLTENTRSCYPLEFIPNASRSGLGPPPRNIVMLTADAFGVLPPISKLTTAQAMYHFLSGYTAKVAGTERGLGSEPVATFSTCFGAPFMARHPSVYGGTAGAADRRAQGRLLAGQHRLERQGRADVDCAYPRHDRCRSQRLAGRGGDRPASGIRPALADRLPRRAARGPRPAHELAGQGRIRRAGRRPGAGFRRQLRALRAGCFRRGQGCRHPRACLIPARQTPDDALA